MEPIELLKHWKKFVDLAIQETYLAFRQDRRLFLTEGDVQCYLYNELRKIIKIQPYSVHAEVTHRAAHQNRGGYRFRDLVLLNPEKIRNAFQFPDDNDLGLKSSGFSHIGESVFIEIKFKRREGIRINPNDLENLRTYLYDGGNANPKFAILVWGSKYGFFGNDNLVQQIEEAIQYFSDHVGEIHIPFDHVFAFAFNHEELWEIKWDGVAWVSNQIAAV
jgi:hypothetical protein